VYRWLEVLGVPFVQGTIETLELPSPMSDEPGNIEFFMEWDVPLECDATQDGEDDG